VLKACAAASKIIIMQAANTGITGGSTPDGNDYDREIVIVSTSSVHSKKSPWADGNMDCRKLRASPIPVPAILSIIDQANFGHAHRDEGDKAFLHRFAVAGAAIRYRAIHRRDVEDIIALDTALRRNDRNWVEILPDEITKPDYPPALLRGLLLSRISPGLRRQERPRPGRTRAPDVETARCAQRRIPGRAQCR
jgi:D-lactate dehydrogenase, membrane binding